MREARRGAQGGADLTPPRDTGITSRLSVIVPATDDPPTLARVLTAIRSAADPPEEVIVVDRPPGLGPAAARNLGAERAAGEILVFVDSDVEIHAGAFARIRALFAGDPDLTAVFGSYDDNPDGGHIVSDFRNLLHHHVHQQGAGEATTFWAGLGAVRRDAFEQVGGFDESIRWLEDVELGLRLHRHGSRIVLDPAVQGKHLKRWTLATMIETDLLGRGVPWIHLLLENRSHSTALNLGWRHRVGTGVSLLLVASLARRKVRTAALALALALALERDLYRLLLRQRGWPMVAAGIPLHVAHRLTSAVAVPLGVTSHLLARRRRRAGGGPSRGTPPFGD